jgi:hypothetical protein
MIGVSLSIPHLAYMSRIDGLVEWLAEQGRNLELCLGSLFAL